MGPYKAKKYPIEYKLDKDLLRLLSEANLKYGEYKTMLHTLEFDARYFLDSVLLTESYKSTQIEGTQISQDEMYYLKYMPKNDETSEIKNIKNSSNKKTMSNGVEYVINDILAPKKDLITDDCLPGTPTMMKYKIHADNASLYNTPPAYGIYICGKVFKWIKKMGGLEVMKQKNEEKAKVLYDFLDQSEMFKGTVAPEDRSLMNVPFVTGDAELDAKFVKEAKEAGFENLKGHRSVGGMRASIYNAMPIEGVEKLVEFMKKFEKENM